MKTTLWMLIGLVLIWTPQAVAQCGTCDPCKTTVGGLITTDTTWTSAGSPYCVTSSIVVGNGATLTIGPGVEIRFKRGLGMTIGKCAFGPGTLVARGSAEAPICFTTNDPCENPPNPAEPGDWARIFFDDCAADATFDAGGNYVAGCIMEYCNVEYSGSAGPAITATNASLCLAHCQVHDNAQGGVHIDASEAKSVVIKYCHVHHHSQGRGIDVTSAATWPVRIESCEVDHCTHSYWVGGGIALSAGAGHRVVGNHVHDCGITQSWGDCAGGGIWVNAPSTLENNTVVNNYAYNDAGYNTAFGGGICLDSYSDGSTVRNNVVSGNWANSYYGAEGGGISLWNSTGSILSGNTVSNNWADGWGGGISLSGSTDCTLNQNTVSGNDNGWSPSWKGGGICLRNSWNCIIADNTITNNHTDAVDADGAGLYLYNSSTGNGPAAGIQRNTISSNWTSQDASEGAGVCLENSSWSVLKSNVISGNQTLGASADGVGVTLRDSTGCLLLSNVVTDNQGLGAEDDGAGMALVNSSACTLDSNIVTGNTCTDEGAGLFFWSSSDATLRCNAIVENAAAHEGGAIWLGGPSNNCTLTMCRITHNHTATGQTGGIYLAGGTNLKLSGDPAVPCLNNTIGGNDGYDIYNNNASGPAANDIVAANNRWVCECAGDPSSCLYDCFDNGAKACVLWYPVKSAIMADMNCDGAVNNLDIDGFVVTLFDGPYDYVNYYKRWPCGDHTLADINQDCAVNNLDIDGFVECLLNFGCP